MTEKFPTTITALSERVNNFGLWSEFESVVDGNLKNKHATY